MPRTYAREPLLDRFMRRVSPEPNSGCWLWDGATTKGYGVTSWGGRNGAAYATHVALFLDGRPRPDAKAMACHHCDVPLCVNPAHLYWGSHSANIQDSYDRDRRISPVTVHDLRGERSPRWRGGVGHGGATMKSQAVAVTARQVKDACFGDW